MCQSIYKQLISNDGGRIRGFERNKILIDDNPLRELVTNIIQSKKKIMNDLKLHSNNFTVINYSRLCSNPNLVMKEIFSKNLRCLKVKRRDIDSEFLSFQESNTKKLSHQDWASIEKIIKELS